MSDARDDSHELLPPEELYQPAIPLLESVVRTFFCFALIGHPRMT